MNKNNIAISLVFVGLHNVGMGMVGDASPTSVVNNNNFSVRSCIKGSGKKALCEELYAKENIALMVWANSRASTQKPFTSQYVTKHVSLTQCQLEPRRFAPISRFDKKIS